MISPCHPWNKKQTTEYTENTEIIRDFRVIRGIKNKPQNTQKTLK